MFSETVASSLTGAKAAPTMKKDHSVHGNLQPGVVTVIDVLKVKDREVRLLFFEHLIVVIIITTIFLEIDHRL